MQNEVIEEWIQKADEDYKAALSLLPNETPYVICFHSQQCIEKYLKALLIANGETPPQTNNLIRLNSMATKYHKSLEDIYDSLEELNPYSVPIRYPGINITQVDAEKAIDLMNDLRARLKDLIEK